MKRIFVIIIIVCFAFFLCGCSYKYKFGDFEFVGDRLDAYTGTDTEVIIPHAYVNGSKVIEVKYIDKKAFTGNSIIKSVLLPETLERLEKEQFKDCHSLEYVYMFDGPISIPESAFENCYNLISIRASSNVTAIKDKAFKNCASLSSVILPNTMVSIGAEAFSNCISLSSLNLNNELKEIKEYAFSNCVSLENVSLTENVQTIGDYAFSGCVNLKNIEFNSKSFTLGDYAFSNCFSLEKLNLSNCTKVSASCFLGMDNLKEISLENNNTLQYRDGIIYDRSSLSLIYCPPWATNEKVIIGADIINIDSYAFYNNQYIKEIVIKAPYILLAKRGIKILKYAFYNCPNLSSVSSNYSIGLIEEYAFYNCPSLQSVIVHESIKMNDNSFYGCLNVEVTKGLPN